MAAADATLRRLRKLCLAGAFGLPLALLLAAQFTLLAAAPATLLVAAALLQYLGLLAERWLFFAEANHPQNLYYQRMS